MALMFSAVVIMHGASTDALNIVNWSYVALAQTFFNMPESPIIQPVSLNLMKRHADAGYGMYPSQWQAGQPWWDYTTSQWLYPNQVGH